MSSPTNVIFSDSLPPAKPDSANIEWQGDLPVPDPNSPGNLVRDVSGCYRFPQVGGVFVIDDNVASPYDVSLLDSGQLLVVNTTGAVTLKLPSAVPYFPYLAQGVWHVKIKNIGTGTVTIDPNGIALDGSTSTFTLATGSGFDIYTEGSAYYTTGNFSTPPTFVDEVPTGAIDGSNTSFTISHAPNPALSLQLESDGTSLAPTVGYSISGTTLTLVFAPAQTLIARYRY